MLSQRPSEYDRIQAEAVQAREAASSSANEAGVVLGRERFASDLDVRPNQRLEYGNIPPTPLVLRLPTESDGIPKASPPTFGEPASTPKAIPHPTREGIYQAREDEPCRGGAVTGGKAGRRWPRRAAAPGLSTRETIETRAGRTEI